LENYTNIPIFSTYSVYTITVYLQLVKKIDISIYNVWDPLPSRNNRRSLFGGVFNEKAPIGLGWHRCCFSRNSTVISPQKIRLITFPRCVIQARRIVKVGTLPQRPYTFFRPLKKLVFQLFFCYKYITSTNFRNSHIAVYSEEVRSNER
jgi:hypothetical protein